MPILVRIDRHYEIFYSIGTNLYVIGQDILPVTVFKGSSIWLRSGLEEKRKKRKKKKKKKKKSTLSDTAWIRYSGLSDSLNKNYNIHRVQMFKDYIIINLKENRFLSKTILCNIHVCTTKHNTLRCQINFSIFSPPPGAYYDPPFINFSSPRMIVYRIFSNRTDGFYFRAASIYFFQNHCILKPLYFNF